MQDGKILADSAKAVAAEYLARKLDDLGSTYDMAITAYALHVANHRNKEIAYKKLKEMQKYSECPVFPVGPQLHLGAVLGFTVVGCAGIYSCRPFPGGSVLHNIIAYIWYFVVRNATTQ